MPSALSDLKHNLPEIYASLSGLGVNAQLPLAVIAQNRVCHSHSWATLTDRLFGSAQSSEGAMEVVRHTINGIFNQAVVQEAYAAYQQRVLNWVKLIGKGTQPEQDPPTAENITNRKERYRQYMLSAFGCSPGESSSDADALIQHFDAEISQAPLTSSRSVEIRQQVTACSEATRPFWQLFMRRELSGLAAPLQPLLNQGTAITNKTLYASFKRAQALIDLEGILGFDIPVEILAKLNEATLSIGENQQLEKFVTQLNLKKSEIGFKNFQHAMQEIVAIINIDGQHPTTLEKMIQKLEELHCELVHEEDPEHMEWREKLIPGSTVECNGEILRLGEELGDKIVNNEHRVFALVGERHQGHVVKIARNCFQLRIEALKWADENHHWGVQPTQTIAIDRDGRCVVMEKLANCLSDVKWESRAPRLHVNEERRVLTVANHIFCMHQWEGVPRHLDPQDLMFDSRGVLKTVRLLKKESFNYNILEYFCYLVAKGNAYILSFLMHVSRLNQHKVALFYKEAVEYTLRTGETNLLSLPQPTRYKNPLYDEHVERLCEQAKQLRIDCFVEAKALLRRQGNHHYAQDDQLKEAVYQRLLQFYKASGTPGTLADTLKDKVVQSFLQQNEEVLSVLQSESIDYYNTSFQTMMEYNRAAVNAV